MGIAVWCEDEAGPYQTIPYPGASWQPARHPLRQPHEYFQEGTAKMLTLLHPRTGAVRVKGVTNTRNDTLHGWLKTELAAILDTLPEPTTPLDANSFGVNPFARLIAYQCYPRTCLLAALFSAAKIANLIVLCAFQT